MATITCTDTINLTQLLEPLMLKSVFKEGEFDIGPIIDIIVQEKIEQNLLSSIEIPDEFADLGSIVCLMVTVNKLKAVTAVLRGETPPEGTGMDKVLELIVNLQMLSSIGSALGGGTGGETSGSTGG